MKQVSSLKTLVPFIIYLVFVMAIMPRGFSLYVRMAFFLYALFIFWILWHYIFSNKQEQVEIHGQHRFFLCLLMFSGVFLCATRFVLFLRYGEAPLGYDTGFYLKSIEDVVGGIGGDRSIRAFLWVPLVWLGIPKIYILHGLYVLFQFLIAGSLYTLARTLHISSRLNYAATLVFLFVVSLPQFFAFWWMFYQMELALAFFLITLALIHRRSLLAIVTAGLGAAIHPATFLPFGIVLGFFVIAQVARSILRVRRLEKETIFMIIIMFIGLVSLKMFGGEFISTYLDASVKTYGWFYTNYPVHLRQQFTGLYIDLHLFHLSSLYILPFAGIGIILFIFRKFKTKNIMVTSRLFFLLIFLAALFILSRYPFIYQNRYIILLDIVLLIFAAYPFMYLLQYFVHHRSGRTVIILLLFGFVMYNSYNVWKQPPQVFPDELQAIKAIAKISSPSDYVMSTESVYTPWVYGFTERIPIDPGYFKINRWDYEMWQEFWSGKSNARRHELLHAYERPIFIFVGKSVPETMAYKKFIEHDPHFIRVSMYVWYYDPRNITDEDILIMKQLEI